jgi:hypothetical protein
MEHRDIAAIAAAAEALHASIQIHKTAQESHRRQAKRQSIALEQLRAAYRRLTGVDLEITQTPRRSQ